MNKRTTALLLIPFIQQSFPTLRKFILGVMGSMWDNSHIGWEAAAVGRGRNHLLLSLLSAEWVRPFFPLYCSPLTYVYPMLPRINFPGLEELLGGGGTGKICSSQYLLLMDRWILPNILLPVIYLKQLTV